ncbi:MAG: hypothetical protein ACLTAF_02485 [Blautia coccoides]
MPERGNGADSDGNDRKNLSDPDDLSVLATMCQINQKDQERPEQSVKGGRWREKTNSWNRLLNITDVCGVLEAAYKKK